MLIDHLEDTVAKNGIDPTIQEAAKKCRKKLLEYYNKTNKIYLLAVILDPRFKIQYYEDNGWEEYIDDIQKK